MALKLVGAIILLLGGISLIIFSSRIGNWLSNARVAYRNEMKKIRGECRDGSCVSSLNTTALKYGRTFDTWLIRAIGLVFLVGAAYLIFIALTNS